jgi:hypothetical protein
MFTNSAFLKAMEREGYVPQAAQRTFAAITTRLEQVGYRADTTFYVYRTGKHHATEAGMRGELSRRLLVFASPDDALAFAQRHQLQPSPRLVAMQLAQLLIVMVKHASIPLIIFTEEDAALSPDTQLPTILCLKRSEILAMLREV